MQQTDNSIHRLNKLIKENGKESLLPQNLPDDILEVIMQEAIAFEEEIDDNIPVISLMVILELKSDTFISSGSKLEISIEGFMDAFYVYSSSIKLEVLRRNGEIFIAKETLPTLENILDGNRILNVTSYNG